MRVARHGTGVRADIDALLSQVHPVFMLPPLAASLFGGILAGTLDSLPATVHVVAMFFAVYTAHVKDGYIDFHHRGEDDDHPLTVHGCRVALLVSSIGFWLATAALVVVATPITAVLAAPTWMIAYNHAPTLDMHTVTTTLGYPTGIALSLLGGYHAQAGSLATEPLVFAGIFLVLLTGIKVIDDSQDYDYDRSIEKRTVAVVFGTQRARRFAYTLQAAAMLLTTIAALLGVIPLATLLGVAAFGVVAAFAARADPETATMLLVRAAYVFLAFLVAAVWLQPTG